MYVVSLIFYFNTHNWYTLLSVLLKIYEIFLSRILNFLVVPDVCKSRILDVMLLSEVASLLCCWKGI